MSELRAGDLGLLAAIVNDPEHRERISALQEQYRAIDQRVKDAQTQEAKNAELLRQAAREHSDAEATTKMNAEHEERLKAFEANLHAVNEQINAEKARWGEQKDLIERQHTETAAQLNAREQLMLERERSIKAREDAVGGREDSARVMAEAARKIIEWAKHGPDL